MIQPGYDPVYDFVFQNRKNIARSYVYAVDTAVETVSKYRKQTAAGIMTVVGRFSPFLAAVNLFHLGYRGAAYLEHTWPGFWTRRSAEFIDAGRYYSGDTDFDTYYDGQNWEDFHDHVQRKKTGRPHRPVYVRGDLF